jgi:Xaa-Pro aminopeptidase
MKYFFHGTSHYLGLDVHDEGTHGRLLPNSVITVEPGIYIPFGSDCDEKWWGIGIRIEDDVLITETEPEVLSACVPKTIDEIEVLMKKESLFNLMKR